MRRKSILMKKQTLKLREVNKGDLDVPAFESRVEKESINLESDVSLS